MTSQAGGLGILTMASWQQTAISHPALVRSLMLRKSPTLGIWKAHHRDAWQIDCQRPFGCHRFPWTSWNSAECCLSSCLGWCHHAWGFCLHLLLPKKNKQRGIGASWNGVRTANPPTVIEMDRESGRLWVIVLWGQRLHHKSQNRKRSCETTLKILNAMSLMPWWWCLRVKLFRRKRRCSPLTPDFLLSNLNGINLNNETETKITVVENLGCPLLSRHLRGKSSYTGHKTFSRYQLWVPENNKKVTTATPNCPVEINSSKQKIPKNRWGLGIIKLQARLVDITS